MDQFVVISSLLIISFIMYGALSPKTKTTTRFCETPRKIVQIAIGLVVIAMSLIFTKFIIKSILLVAIFTGIVICILRVFKIKIKIIEKCLDMFERPNAQRGFGAFAYFAGMLFCLSVYEFWIGIAMIYLLSVCDSVATIVGKTYGKTKLFYNRSKSLEGLLAFLLFSAPLVWFGGISMLWVVILAVIFETIDLGIDDNVLIPLAGFAYGFA